MFVKVPGFGTFTNGTFTAPYCRWFRLVVLLPFSSFETKKPINKHFTDDKNKPGVKPGVYDISNLKL